MRTAAKASNLVSTWPVTGIAFFLQLSIPLLSKGVLKEKSVNKEKKGQDDSDWREIYEKIYCPSEYHSFSNYINVDNYVKKLLFLAPEAKVNQCEKKPSWHYKHWIL
jgi:hypothetical protein